ncbi:MAG: alpha/beta hydrolase [Actinomycetota bacterium]|nr:alpha/beta hydrolase [Actinomycetota bacterium]
MPHRALLLPGSVLPAEPAYADLVDALGPEADCCVKDLEVYRSDQPPDAYDLGTEVEGVLREADARGWDRFHLVGYSGGGAAALAVAARHPDRLCSLALLEPAWAGTWDWSPEHTAFWEQLGAIEGLPAPEFMAAFRASAVRPGVPLPEPPPGPPPPWMVTRPAGISAFLHAFRTGEIPRAALAAFGQPVYFALGGLSNPDQYGEIASRLSTVFPDFTVEVFEDRHHFDPPHRVEPQRLAQSLRDLWGRAG